MRLTFKVATPGWWPCWTGDIIIVCIPSQSGCIPSQSPLLLQVRLSELFSLYPLKQMKVATEPKVVVGCCTIPFSGLVRFPQSIAAKERLRRLQEYHHNSTLIHNNNTLCSYIMVQRSTRMCSESRVQSSNLTKKEKVRAPRLDGNTTLSHK